VHIKQALLRYLQQNFASFGRRLTPLKCDEIYDIDFVVNFK